MKTLQHLLAIAALGGFATGANAGLIDFAAIADGSTGESAWDTYLFSDPDGFNLSVTGSRNGQAAYAYLDRGTAGMGVCGSLNSEGEANKNSATNSKDNLCEVSHDDNVTADEMLTLIFDEQVSIDTIWFNNFHDKVDTNLNGETIDINNIPYLLTNGDGDNPSFTTSPYIVGAGTPFNIAYNSEEFYLQMMTVSLLPPVIVTNNPVPVPAPILLMSLGLVGLGWSRRRRS